ncbi:hypothetical protein SAMN02910276_00997 [Butyrivibrio sp. Su6]|uniref:hypothetical protein n=1 Tax=Butyrivibrio sp. Su6 TaxID=1520810 RepID=UPI00089F0C26|nr:hypothetical protein [Butyrivibrio sp. Su6]SEF76592.1 hypothetical protein SAMN02910276_00997 [Butyrivibrio sp. Su6]
MYKEVYKGEYVSRMYGVVVKRDKLIWSSIKEDEGFYKYRARNPLPMKSVVG